MAHYHQLLAQHVYYSVLWSECMELWEESHVLCVNMVDGLRNQDCLRVKTRVKVKVRTGFGLGFGSGVTMRESVVMVWA